MEALQQEAHGSPAQSEASSDVAEYGSKKCARYGGSLTLEPSFPSTGKVSLSALHDDLTNLAGRLDSIATETRQIATEMRDSSDRTNAA